LANLKQLDQYSFTCDMVPCLKSTLFTALLPHQAREYVWCWYWLIHQYITVLDAAVIQAEASVTVHMTVHPW